MRAVHVTSVPQSHWLILRCCMQRGQDVEVGDKVKSRTFQQRDVKGGGSGEHGVSQDVLSLFGQR